MSTKRITLPIFLHLLPFHGIIKRSCILYDIPMKRLFTVLLLISIVIVPVSASSWRVGGEAGYALNFMDTVTIWPRTEYRPGHGAEAAFIGIVDARKKGVVAEGMRMHIKNGIGPQIALRRGQNARNKGL